jgi:hypothetical protein
MYYTFTNGARLEDSSKISGEDGSSNDPGAIVKSSGTLCAGGNNG